MTKYDITIFKNKHIAKKTFRPFLDIIVAENGMMQVERGRTEKGGGEGEEGEEWGGGGGGGRRGRGGGEGGGGGRDKGRRGRRSPHDPLQFQLEVDLQTTVQISVQILQLQPTTLFLLRFVCSSLPVT